MRANQHGAGGKGEQRFPNLAHHLAGGEGGKRQNNPAQQRKNEHSKPAVPPVSRHEGAYPGPHQQHSQDLVRDVLRQKSKAESGHKYRAGRQHQAMRHA